MNFLCRKFPSEISNNKFTHVNDDGKAIMIDITTKANTNRTAISQCTIKVCKNELNIFF